MKNHPIRALHNGVAVLDNKLVDACYRMSLTEKRLFNMAIASVNSKKHFDGGYVSVSIDDFSQLCNITKNAALKRCREAIGDLRNAHVIDIEYKDPNKFLDKIYNKTETENVRRLSHKNFFQEVEYLDCQEAQVVRFKFSDWLHPFIAQLERKFTKIRLQHVSQLTSFYSMRIYEAVILRMADSEKAHERTFEIPELRRVLGLTDGMYARWVDLKKRCVVSAVKDLNNKTPFNWVMTVNGRGKYLRNVTIKATPVSQKQEELPLE